MHLYANDALVQQYVIANRNTEMSINFGANVDEQLKKKNNCGIRKKHEDGRQAITGVCILLLNCQRQRYNVKKGRRDRI